MPIKVLIIDDSALVRQTISEILNSTDDIKVISTAPDPIIGVRKIHDERPDVIILDIEMARMDGLTFLRKMNETIDPIPCIICSALVDKDSPEASKAIEYGAAEIILKPSVGTKKFLEESKIRLVDAVKSANLCQGKIKQLIPSQAAAHTNFGAVTPTNQIKSAQRKFQPDDVEELEEIEEPKMPPLPEAPLIQPKLSADVILEKPNPALSPIDTTEPVVIVGASTGGTEALKDFLTMLPVDSPGLVIVQHMPEHFMKKIKLLQ